MPLSLLALAVAAFGIGTTEFVIMGLLPEVAEDLGVSIPSAGMLISGYALGVVVGAPVLAVLTARLARKTALLLLMVMFILGNALCALSADYILLMAARVFTAFCHGTFFGIGSVVAAELVPRNRRAQAVALMFTGLTLANVLGVPFGTALGQAAGWRATFWCVVLIGIAALAAIALLVPAPRGHKPASLLQEMKVLRKPQVILAMLISILSSAGLFTVFTYIAPILREVTGVSPSGVTWVLVLLGVGLTLGNLLGGRLADWKLMPSLIGIFATTAVVVTSFSVTSQWLVPAVATIFLWGLSAFAVGSPLQYRVVSEAGEAPNLPAILNQGAFNLGNAAGAWLGALVIDRGLGYAAIPLAAGGVVALALVLTVVSKLLEDRDASRCLAPAPAGSPAP